MTTAWGKALFTYRFIAQHPLTKDRKASAMLRYVNWQFKSRLRKGKQVIPFIGATRLQVARSMTGATGNIYVGLHEFRDMAFVLHLLRAGDVFFDVGANVGTYTVLAAGVAGASVIAFEPNGVTFGHLRDNVRLNDLDAKVQCVQSAIGATHGTVRFTVEHDTVNHVAAEGEQGVDVPLNPLDDWADRSPIAMKVDVEGFEDAVLAGATGLLGSESLQAILIEANQSASRYGKTDQGVHETLVSAGFILADYDPMTRRLTPVAQNHPGEVGNGLYVRDFARVEARLKAAEPFRVHGRTI